MADADIGVIGLGVMGRNLALNLADHDWRVVGLDRDKLKVAEFVAGDDVGGRVAGAHTAVEFVQALKSPRVVLIMVPAGGPVDAVLEEISPLLEAGDTLIDGGNSYFIDTKTRIQSLERKGQYFIGMGVSGGEEGARSGPSLMPGGSESAWPRVRDMFQAIAAKASDGAPCCEWIGPQGAGHFVKMVHNGIEYTDMQLISEAYAILSQVVGLEPDALAQVFDAWNEGDLDSYLIEITAQIFREKDTESGRAMIDVILDAAGQKGTGKWTSQIALDLGVPAATIAEAVFARTVSAIKEERVLASSRLAGPEDRPFDGDVEGFIEDVRQALYASKICAYAQGFALLKAASEAYRWGLKLGEIALLWREGCIIRAHLLSQIHHAFQADLAPANLMLDPSFQSVLTDAQTGWRRIVAEAVQRGIPIPAFSSALAYYDSYRCERLPANLLQAQRDYFGAHTFERVDHPRGEHFHHEWGVSSNPIASS